ncbi:hypothetical protein Poli38472_001445 [Pythium oligandrum]|uniref:S5 DRBM domain-containing protein n=1 Tax=Pythium oligandrum TaxID=41045 RepID=A0A8K1CU47_PYTOL|nr:hypothetical protein Poli38472_001445 [Pythium oligandrum]|eukprot:TMW69289.1 hypothetical protein Poli38472_001445 [Pythium oligandrum]
MLHLHFLPQENGTADRATHSSGSHATKGLSGLSSIVRMLQRFAARAAVVSRQRIGASVAQVPAAHFSSEFDFEEDEGEFDEPLFHNFDNKPVLPRRQNMPEAARKSRFQVVAPENRGKVRRRILDEFKKEQFSVEGHVPDAGVLEDLREMNAESEDMTFANEQDDDELNLGRLGLLRQIVHVDKVQKVTTQGNILRFRAMVVVGNRRGCAGYAVGKGSSVPEAILRGTKLAMKNFTFIDRFDERTLYHEVRGKWNSCTLFLRPAPSGKGLTVSDTVACVLDCFGITDVVSKCHGQRNPYTVIRATFDALTKHETAEEIALKTGHSLVEISKLAKSRNL